MKKLILYISALALIGCASTSEKNVAIEGYTFTTGKPSELVIPAIVATLQDENISITNINEKYGIIGTGLQDVPSATVAKWRGDSSFGLGTSTWKVEINFNVKNNGEVRLKYCLSGKAMLSSLDSCIPYKSDVSAKYFENKIISKL